MMSGPWTVTQNSERAHSLAQWPSNSSILDQRNNIAIHYPRLELTYDLANALLQGRGYEIGGGEE